MKSYTQELKMQARVFGINKKQSNNDILKQIRNERLISARKLCHTEKQSEKLTDSIMKYIDDRLKTNSDAK